MDKKCNLIYCTIAIGEQYLNSAIKMAESLNQYSDNHNMLIVTDKNINNFKNTHFVKIPDTYVLFIQNIFNYMLKFYPMYLANKLNYDYIIFIDADWRIKSSYNKDNVNSLLDYMEKNNFDILFERPCNIGIGKKDDINCFWKHKVDFYNLKETNEYDDGHVCNEQFIVFRKNEKFNLFVNKFKELYELSTDAKLWPFAEGLEIGMSMAYSKMKYDYLGWQNYLRGMFEFNTKDEKLYIRF